MSHILRELEEKKAREGRRGGKKRGPLIFPDSGTV